MSAQDIQRSPLAEDGSLLFYLLMVAWLLCSGV
ncbi:MAG: hypothetical protein GAK43_02141 [Stenotrophomonas maltophilia]|nr:MAG: hypothetical protein GAK43_02141 [Stenotrophomonas maltophilia]